MEISIDGIFAHQHWITIQNIRRTIVLK